MDTDHGRLSSPYGATDHSHEDSLLGYQSLDADGRFADVNPAWLAMLGYQRDEVIGRSFRDFLTRDSIGRFDRGFQELKRSGSIHRARLAVVCRTGAIIDVEIDGIASRDAQGRFSRTHCIMRDITKQLGAERELRQIEWLLRAPDTLHHEWAEEATSVGLAELNTDRMILAAVGKDILRDIIRLYLDMLDTNAAVCEKNGDYALAVTTSRWCRRLVEASRRLCDTNDNREALASGRWLCRQSCWAFTSRQTMLTGHPLDAPCLGGIRVHAVPIRCGDEIIGAIAFGYGNPPTDRDTLLAIADKYRIDSTELADLATAYQPRPAFIVEVAKQRLTVSAELIGTLVQSRRIQETLRRSEANLREAQRVARLGSWELDLGTQEAIWSAEMFHITGFDPSSGVPTMDRFLKWVHPEDRERVSDVNKRVVETGEPASVEFRTNADAPECLFMIGHLEPIRRGNGPVTGLMGTLYDVTEQRRNQEQMREHQAQLTHLWRVNTIAEMSAALAHEINQPLTAIRNFAAAARHILGGSPPADPQIGKALDRILEQAQRAGEIVRRVRSHIQKQPSDKKEASINAIVRNVMEMARHEALRDAVRMRFTGGKGLPPVLVDRIEIEQVLLNLIRNAFDAMQDTAPGGRCLTIITAVRPDNMVEVAVCDTGKGLPDDSQRVFEAFYTTKDGGLGIGLSLSRTIIRDHGGALECRPNPTGGACFSFTLPAASISAG